MSIHLTSEDRAFWNSLQAHDYNSSSFEANQVAFERQRFLTESLIKRNAIPDNRWRYFTDPEFNAGRSNMSRMQIFESNGTKGSEIFSDGNFAKYLRYFIEGPDLPQSVKEKIFELYRDEPSKKDVPDLIYKYLISRKADLKIIANYDLAEEIYKALLDNDCVLYVAKSIRQKLKAW